MCRYDDIVDDIVDDGSTFYKSSWLNDNCKIALMIIWTHILPISTCEKYIWNENIK